MKTSVKSWPITDWSRNMHHPNTSISISKYIRATDIACKSGKLKNGYFHSFVHGIYICGGLLIVEIALNLNRFNSRVSNCLCLYYVYSNGSGRDIEIYFVCIYEYSCTVLRCAQTRSNRFILMIQMCLFRVPEFQ